MNKFKIPNSAVSNIQIDKYAQTLRMRNFIGHRMRDELNKNLKDANVG